MREVWKKWNPINDDFGKMYLEELIKTKGAMKILLKSEEQNIALKFLFDGEVLSFCCSDEGRRLKTINELDKKYGTDFYKNQSYFIVENSRYANKFNKETYNIYNNFKILHYVFLLSDDVIDILSAFPPRVSIIKAN